MTIQKYHSSYFSLLYDAHSQVMALEHKTLPISAVQFHPESILTNPSYGLTILSNCLNCLSYKKNV